MGDHVHSDLVVSIDFESFVGSCSSTVAFDANDEVYASAAQTHTSDGAIFPPAFISAVRSGLDQTGLVLIDNIDLSPADFLALAKFFGPALDLPKQLVPKKVAGFPELARVSNYDEETKVINPAYAFGAYWHHDGDFWPEQGVTDAEQVVGVPKELPKKVFRHNHIVNLLHSKITPQRGGQTDVLSTVRAFERLQEKTCGAADAALASARIKVDPANIEDFRGIPQGDWLTEAVPDRTEHAVVQEVRGQKSLYLPFFVGEVELGKGLGGTTASYDELFAKFFGDEAGMREAGLLHEQVWRPRQILAWDNLKTMHKARGGIEGRRLMWRAQATTDDWYGAQSEGMEAPDNSL